MLRVCIYCLVREAKKPTFVRLDKSSNEELKTNTKSICEVRCGWNIILGKVWLIKGKEWLNRKGKVYR